MPNHIHAIVRPIAGFDLDAIWESWKKFTARQLADRGVAIRPVWFSEGYDRIVREVEHLQNIVGYIGRNPAKAGLTREECQCWLHPAWIEAGWNWGEETESR
ncbi:MAG: REP element-mobilizing transposase RayT [Verrucomicrobiales bacterium]|jgi:REP element-mobilizing transposase RayT